MSDGTAHFIDTKEKRRVFSRLPTVVQADASHIKHDEDDWNLRQRTETTEAEAKKSTIIQTLYLQVLNKSRHQMEAKLHPLFQASVAFTT